MLNPANVNFQMIGVSRKDVMKKMISAINVSKEEQRVYVVHGFDGMDEISLSDDSYLMRFENGKIFDEEIINPEKFGFKKVALEAIKGGNPKYNAEKLVALLDGEKTAYRDIVILNSAFGLLVAGKVDKVSDGIDLARSIIDSGKAREVLRVVIS